ncbi:MAG TPA: hypothetical protein DCX13_02150 [Rhodobacteraceae bacterium]|jgi:tetratricopeptide (TPR) repeat protein|nr:hypothetical protein [Paracoccaceae bacterium]
MIHTTLAPSLRRTAAFGRGLLGATIALWLALVPPLRAEPQRLTLTQARDYAAQLLAADETRAAHAVIKGLLTANPRDPTALLLLVQAERRLGNLAAAETAARQAHREARSPTEAFAAAFSLSQILAQQKKFTQSQFWLRRARQDSDRPDYDALAEDRHRKITQLNPWRSEFRFWLSPSDNINGGPTTNTFAIGTLVFINPAAVPASGVEYGLRFATSRRLGPLTPERGETRLGLRLLGTRYSLTDATKAALPGLSAASLSYSLLEAEIDHSWTSASGARSYGALTLGRDESGGAPLSNIARITLRHDLPAGPQRAYSLTADLERRSRLDQSLRSSTTLGLGGELRQRLANGTLLRLSARLSDTNSASNEIAQQAAEVGVSLSGLPSFFGTDPSLSLAYQLRDYDIARYGPDPRRDRQLRLSVDFALPKFDYMGFSPTLGLTFKQTKSNVPLFTTQETGISLGFRSNF